MLVGVSFDLLLGAERTNQHALHLAGLGLLRRNQSLAHLLGDQRMVDSKLHERTRAEQVGATIAHMGEAELLAIEPCGEHRGAHPAVRSVASRRLMNLAVRQVDGAGQAVGLFRKTGLWLPEE